MRHRLRLLCLLTAALGLLACGSGPEHPGEPGPGEPGPGETGSVAWSAAPSSPTRDSSATFAVTCAPEDCALTCALDGADPGPCPSPLQYEGLAEGEHTLRLVASWGDARKELLHRWRVDVTAPSVVSARFDSYGEVKVVFDEPIDATAAAQLSHYTFGPDKPAGIEVVGTSVAGEVLRLYLSAYQLPTNYSLTLTAQDVLGNVRSEVTVELGAGETGSRVAFISRARGDGNLRQWDALPAGANPATGLEAADTLCQQEAAQAGLTGTFRAFLSDSHDDAGCRLLRLGGKLQTHCGLASAPVADTGPWIGTDGLPLVRGHAELFNGHFLRPVSREATGTPLSASLFVWHATSTSGTTAGQALANPCQDWSSNANQTAPSAQVSATRLPFRLAGTSNCSGSNQGLLCVQVDAGGFSLNPRYRQEGKVAFVTSTTTSGRITHGDLTGTAAADALCQERAAAAGLSHPGHFVAWLSDSTTDAYCRVLGLDAKRSQTPACGASSPPSTGPWVTTTGFLFADDLEALVTSSPRLPLFATESETFPSVNNAWTGTKSDGTSSGAGCTDWSNLTAGSGGTKGFLPEATQWTALGADTCTVTAHLLCLER